MAQVVSRKQGIKQFKSQADEREYREWVDQWDRLWEGTIELKSGDFCGLPPKPKGWAPPFPQWMPPAYTMRCGRLYEIHDKGVTRTLATEEMYIDLAPWKIATLDSNREWREQLFDIGRTMSGDAFDPDAPTPQVLARIGRKPLPVEVILAMEQGNRYVLGLTDVVDERLRPFMPTTLPDYGLDFRDDLGDAPVVADGSPITTRRAKAKARASQE